jgi:hypothetical protein
MDQKVEEGSRERPKGRDDEMTGNESKYDAAEANIYSIECGAEGEAGICSGLEGRRSHKAERLIVNKSG